MFAYSVHQHRATASVPVGDVLFYEEPLGNFQCAFDAKWQIAFTNVRANVSANGGDVAAFPY